MQVDLVILRVSTQRSKMTRFGGQSAAWEIGSWRIWIDTDQLQDADSGTAQAEVQPRLHPPSVFILSIFSLQPP